MEGCVRGDYLKSKDNDKSLGENRRSAAIDTHDTIDIGEYELPGICRASTFNPEGRTPGGSQVQT
jgi:hypothetical protein